jgi:hypothetical protein
VKNSAARRTRSSTPFAPPPSEGSRHRFTRRPGLPRRLAVVSVARFRPGRKPRLARPLVVFLDEIDSLRDLTLLSVLRQLRDGYPDRPDAFPWALALIGFCAALLARKIEK